MATALKYNVGTFRNAGLEARWSRTRYGAPIIMVRNPIAEREHQRVTWWACTRQMWEGMQKSGVVSGFESATLLGDVFSVPA